jgi:transcriptional regulator with XRE-family HTH domain
MRLINQRLRKLRLALDLSQEAMGAQGFVSAPGWAKIENGQRQPGDKLLQELVLWMQKSRHVTDQEGKLLHEELLAIKYMNHSSPFIRRLAGEYHERLARPTALGNEIEGQAGSRKKKS